MEAKKGICKLSRCNSLLFLIYFHCDILTC
nr:MAG TPA: hypothetical protein [Bacteriophage sp.]